MLIGGGIALSLAIMGSIVAARYAHDSGFAAHAWIFATGFLAGLVWLVRRYANGIPADDLTPYADGVVRAGVIASVFWGIAGFLVGLIIALQLSFPNFLYFPDLPFTNFGRLRPLHTSAVIFAFGGNVLIASSFYVVQRTSKARLFGGILPWFVFGGYQLFIVIAATGYLMGITQSKEYAELEWPLDLLITVVWATTLSCAA